MPSFEGNLFTQWHQITSYKKLETLDMVKTRSISPGLESVPGRDRQTHGQTDRRTDRQNSHSYRNTRSQHSAVPAGTAVARKN